MNGLTDCFVLPLINSCSHECCHCIICFKESPALENGCYFSQVFQK